MKTSAEAVARDSGVSTLNAEAAAVAKAEAIVGALSEGPQDLEVVAAVRALQADLAGASPVALLLARRRAITLLTERGVRGPGKVLSAAWPDAQAERDGGNALGSSYAAVDPWPAPVDGVALLTEIARTLEAHVLLPPEASTLIAPWVVGTHCFETWDIFPRLALLSPVKRCGKTTLLRLLDLLVHRPRASSNISPAALFRLIGQDRPTLLIDEGDAFLRHNDELRGILNAGHEKKGCVTRCVGEDFEPRDFPVFCPVVLAAIGELPSTLDDRSVVVRLQRKPSGIEVSKLRSGRIPPALLDIPRKIRRWTTDNQDALESCDPRMPASLDDRAVDNLSPLMAIAQTAGGDWPLRLHHAALAVRGEEIDDSETRTLLLADIRDIFDQKGYDKLSSSELQATLAGMEERPWPEWRNGKEMSTQQLARLLRPFKIRPRTIRQDHNHTPKGYHREDFQDAFSRYLPQSGTATPPHSAESPERDESLASRTRSGEESSEYQDPQENAGFQPTWRSGGAWPPTIESYEDAERLAIQEADGIAPQAE